VLVFLNLSHGIRVGISVALFGSILILALPATFLGSADVDSGTEVPKREHKVKRVLLITIDTLRADFVSALNGSAAATAHIDRLADDSIVFTNAISPAPWTLPSIASLMTGLSPDVHMARKANSKLPEKLSTLAEYMLENGYRTSAIVANPYLQVPHGVNQGFLHYDCYPKEWIHNSFGSRVLKKYFDRYSHQDVTTRDLTDLAIDWIQSNRDRDYFLWIHYLDPHMPYEPPDEWLPKGKAPAA
jgi:choline-sulfatase